MAYTLKIPTIQVIELPKHFVYVMNKLNRTNHYHIEQVVLTKVTDNRFNIINDTKLNLNIQFTTYDDGVFSHYDHFHDLFGYVCTLFKLDQYKHINHMHFDHPPVMDTDEDHLFEFRVRQDFRYL